MCTIFDIFRRFISSWSSFPPWPSPRCCYIQLKWLYSMHLSCARHHLTRRDSRSCRSLDEKETRPWFNCLFSSLFRSKKKKSSVLNYRYRDFRMGPRCMEHSSELYNRYTYDPVRDLKVETWDSKYINASRIAARNSSVQWMGLDENEEENQLSKSPHQHLSRNHRSASFDLQISVFFHFLLKFNEMKTRNEIVLWKKNLFFLLRWSKEAPEMGN